MFSRLRAWLGRAWNWIRNPTPPKWFAIALIIGVGIAVALWLMRLMVVLGPVIGAVISVIAVLGNETAKYYSSTSNLRLSLGLESKKGDSVKDPGLDVEAFELQPQPNHSMWAYRVSAMVINDGKAVIRDAKASLTIKVREKGGKAVYYLGKVLDLNHCGGFLVNKYNPHVIGEALAWALPEKVIPRPNTEYVHITSISPGQRSRLLIFGFMRLSDNEYLVMPFSEYGASGPYRACLKLDKNHEFIFDITVHGEGARSPLSFSLCIDIDKLAGLENAVTNLENAIKQGQNVEQAFNYLLEALNGLRC